MAKKKRMRSKKLEVGRLRKSACAVQRWKLDGPEKALAQHEPGSLKTPKNHMRNTNLEVERPRLLKVGSG
jgi:hypothetical protein